MRILDLLLTFISIAATIIASSFTYDDIETSSECNQLAKIGDHLLFEFDFFFDNGTAFGPFSKRPQQLTHILLEPGVNFVHLKIKQWTLFPDVPIFHRKTTATFTQL